MKDTKNLTDEIRQDRKRTLEGKPLSYKIKYYVYYYKWPVIAVVVTVLILVSIVKTMLNGKDSELGVALLNGLPDRDYESLMYEFEDYCGTDDKHEMTIDSTYTLGYEQQGGFDMSTQEKLFVTIAGGHTNVIIAPKSAFAAIADMGYMSDLRDYLTDEELAKYEGKIYEASVPEDPLDASSPVNKVLAGVEITDARRVVEAGWFYGYTEPVYFGFCGSGEHRERALEFLQYLDR